MKTEAVAEAKHLRPQGQTTGWKLLDRDPADGIAAGSADLTLQRQRNARRAVRRAEGCAKRVGARSDRGDSPVVGEVADLVHDRVDPDSVVDFGDVALEADRAASL